MKFLLIVLVLLSYPLFSNEYFDPFRVSQRVHFTSSTEYSLEKLKHDISTTPKFNEFLTNDLIKEVDPLLIKLKRNNLTMKEKNRAWALIKKMNMKVRNLQKLSPKKIHRRVRKKAFNSLQDWMLKQTIKSANPFYEKMIHFWHNHFTTEFKKVKDASLLYDQHLKIRKNALGNFKDLLNEMISDPAMLLYLDASRSKKNSPNENLARELLELFTLGEGNYTENDIKAIAKVLAGRNYNKVKRKLIERPRNQFKGKITLFGKNRKFLLEDVIDTILQKKETAIFITTKFFKEFVTANPNPKEVKLVAHKFFESGYDIKTLALETFVSPYFFKEEHRASLIKSPIELVVGLLKDLEISTNKYNDLNATLAQLGQSLYNPPNVAGWPGYKNWINAHTLVYRKDFLDRSLRVQEKKKAHKRYFVLDLDKWLKKNNLTKFNQINLKLNSLPLGIEKSECMDLKECVKYIVLHPTYQLK